MKEVDWAGPGTSFGDLAVTSRRFINRETLEEMGRTTWGAAENEGALSYELARARCAWHDGRGTLSNHDA